MTSGDRDVSLDFDPTDPDVMQERVPHDELLTLRRTAPVSFVSRPTRPAPGSPTTAATGR